MLSVPALDLAVAQQPLQPPGSIPAQCDVGGGDTTAVCWGNFSTGLNADGPPLRNLTVQDLTADIGGVGIDFDVDDDTATIDDVTLTVNPNSAFGVTGIDVLVASFPSSTSSNITVHSSADITANGIVVSNNFGTGNITVSSSGLINGVTNGIFASTRFGDISITSTGPTILVNSSNGQANGILANVTGGGDTVINNSSNIDVTADGFLGGFPIPIGHATGINSPGLTGTFRKNISVFNSGDITVKGNASVFGIDVQTELGGTLEIKSTGTIRTNGTIGTGIQAVVKDSGTIKLTSTGSIIAIDDGIFTKFTDISGTGETTITTAGTIIAGNTAIVADRDRDTSGSAPATITSAGILTGGDGLGFTVDLRDNGNDVVNLLPGSVINGAMDFGNANPNDIDTLNFLPGLNATVNFADTGGTGQGDSPLESAPEIVNFSGGGVLINNGLTAVAVDATGFAGQGTMISDVTDAIFNVIDGQGGPSGAGLQSTQAFAGRDRKSGAGGARLWGTAFGGHHHLGGTGSLAPFDHDFGGLATGLEKGDVETTGAFGLFGGYSRSRLSIDSNAGNTDTDTGFGGAYFKRDYGSHRIHAAFAAGVTDNDTTRLVNGVNAESDYNGYFVAPSLTASVPVDLAGRPMHVSGRVAYVYMHLDGYTETGVALPLTVGGRDLSLFNLRAQLDRPRTMHHESGTATRVSWAVGVDATVDAGSEDVNAVVAATPFSFAAETEDEVSAFLGLDIAHTSADGRRTVGLGGELKSNFDGGFEAAGEARASMQF